MCSDPKTKINKGTGEEMTFACRVCNECIATRRHGWVARAMAEKSDWPHALCITLTYSDETQESRDGARMFRYADIRAFLARLRSAARRQAGRVSTIRFICAGEQGDRLGRCHWHIILYSEVDLTTLGEFRLRGNYCAGRKDIITSGKQVRRLNWTLWRFGFVAVQEPDQSAMNYVLSYCLKDQFTEEKTHGTMREAKAENFATGLFRMSKRPAIGENFLMRKMESLLEKNAVLPSLNIKVPGFHGYWQPSGTFRKKLLWCLVALNKRILWATGANAPQWPSLLASCSQNETETGVLNGKTASFYTVPGSLLWKAENSGDSWGFEEPDFDPGETHAYHRLTDAECQSIGLQRYTSVEGRYRYRVLDPENRIPGAVGSASGRAKQILADKWLPIDERPKGS